MSHSIQLQAGVIAIREARVCLITSRNTGRWIVPKGMIDPGFTPQAAALQEAYEEAGLRGTIYDEQVGSFVFEKWGRRHEVALFVMEVTEVLDDWEEANQRERCWASYEEAREMIDDKHLREVVLAVMRGDE